MLADIKMKIHLEMASQNGKGVITPCGSEWICGISVWSQIEKVEECPKIFRAMGFKDVQTQQLSGTTTAMANGTA